MQTKDIMPLAPAGAPLTMSSREIAELTGSTHDNVLKTVRSLVGRGVISGNETPYIHHQNGQTYSEFRLNYRDTMVVVSGYSVELRARIIDRWQALEAQATKPAFQLPDFTNPIEAARAWADECEAKIGAQKKAVALEVANAEMRPKVEAHDRIAESFGAVNRTVAAKNLGVPPQVLIRWMRMNGWTYRQVNSNDDLAYQSKINAGYLEHKVKTGDKPDGTTWTSTSVRVTPKGMLALAKAFPLAVKSVA